MGTEDFKVTAMNMYKYKEGLRFCKRWPCSKLTLTCRFIWGRIVALHDRLKSLSNCVAGDVFHRTFKKTKFISFFFGRCLSFLRVTKFAI